ncbi:hypothetical protein ACWGLF_26950 [Streptomyces puniciscabiei]
MVTVDDTYESPRVHFPNGPLATMPPPPATLDADGRSLPEGPARALDPADVGVFGPSMCRTAAAPATDAGHRATAGIDMDGSLQQPAAARRGCS